MRKSRIPLLIACGCVCAGGIDSIPTLAAGAVPAPPTANSSPATNLTGSTAALNGSVNPNGQQTSYALQWGPTNGYGHETPLTSAGAGTTTENVSATVSGLSGGSTYHFRVIAINAAGTAVGSDALFTTIGTAPAPSPGPAATTAAATNVNQGGATLNGTDNPNGQATSYYFEYGPTPNYGFETAPQSAGSGTATQPASANVTGLPSSTAFHYRLVAVSAGGTALGPDQTFTTTTPPTASTGQATQISNTSVRVNGELNPHGHTTTYFFQYGTTTGYGLQTRPIDAGSGTSNVAVHSVIGALTPKSTYHYRLVAESAGGISYGSDQSVTVGPGQSHVAFMGRMGFVSPGGIIGVEAGCFGGDTRCDGQVTMSLIRTGTLIGQRNFDIAPNSGGFQNIGINGLGKQLLKQNGVWHLLQVDVTVTTTTGQRTSQTMTLARWVWH